MFLKFLHEALTVEKILIEANSHKVEEFNEADDRAAEAK
jgi:hypothetical protein